jgi:hypothetical protein
VVEGHRVRLTEDKHAPLALLGQRGQPSLGTRDLRPRAQPCARTRQHYQAVMLATAPLHPHLNVTRQAYDPPTMEWVTHPRIDLLRSSKPARILTSPLGSRSTMVQLGNATNELRTYIYPLTIAMTPSPASRGQGRQPRRQQQVHAAQDSW